MLPYLLISLAVLALGPLCVRVLRERPAALTALDGFVIITVGGLVLVEILPAAIARGGNWALAAAIGGIFLPLLFEHRISAERRLLRNVVTLLGFVGLALHALIDGLAFHDHGHGDGGSSQLALAVILHRLPVAIAVWWILPPLVGRRAAWGTLGLIAIGTLLGAWCGTHMAANASVKAIGALEALLAGSLLHVVFHAHLPMLAPSPKHWSIPSAAGLILGLAVLFGSHALHGEHDHALVGPGAASHAGHAHDHGHAHGDHDHAHADSAAKPGAGSVFWALARTSAPTLLLAYFVVGLLSAFLPRWKASTFAARTRFGQAARGLAVGLPLPLCSCGVVPVFRHLASRGVPAAAALAFLIATPELEIAAALLSFQLLGPELATARLVAAALLALGCATLVARLAPREKAATQTADSPIDQDGTRLARFWDGAFVKGVGDTAGWILLGLGLAALLQPLIDAEWLASVSPWLAIPLSGLLGMPLYVCASGSTPLVASLIAVGLGPGAALTFLLTGPATNLTTYGVVRDQYGAAVAKSFIVTMALGAMALGAATEALVTLPSLAERALPHAHRGAWWELVCVGLIALLFLLAIVRKGVRPFVDQLFGHGGHEPANSGEESCCSTK